MKFPRNARIFQGRLDAAPFASVFFLLLIFILVGSLRPTPGVRLELPRADDLPGPDRPTVSVAMDATGNLFFKDQPIGTNELRLRLAEAVTNSAEPLTLVIHADRQVAYENIINLTVLAHSAGIKDALQATLPRP
jgi:biopolymer transport protein ExbD